MTGLILIVDDEGANRLLLSTALKNDGYKVLTACDGIEAIQILKRQPIEIILLDLIMPNMDGYELLSKVKGSADWKHIPVIIISIMNDEDSLVECIQLGAADILSKPFNKTLLKARIESSLASKRLHDTEAQISKDLAQHNQDLEAFAHSVAHDLKNPLSIISGYAEQLSYGYDQYNDDLKKEMLRFISENCQRMERIIEAILFHAKIRNEHIVQTPLNMPLIIEEVKGRLSNMIQKETPTFFIEEEWPPIMGYEPWIEEILTNYVSNALKYGGAPPIVEIGSQTLPDGQIQIWVKDNGQGLTAEECQKLFSPFTQLKNGINNGYGLGLSIVQRIVEKFDRLRAFQF